MADPNGANCATCGEPVKVNPKTVGMVYDGKLLTGWYHHDSMKRDHDALPHDMRSADDEATRVRAQMDQARMAVRANLQAKFAYIKTRDSIDDIFNDRRSDS